MSIQRPTTGLGKIDELKQFEARVQQLQGPLFAYLGRLGFEQSMAEDVAQETFLRAWRAKAQFDEGKAQYSTWLFRIARNVAINEIEKRQRVPDTANTEHVMNAPDTAPVVDEVHDAQQLKRLDAALQSLSLEDQETIALSGLDELTNEEAAGVVGCTTATFRTRLSRARARLKKLWELEP